MHLQLDKLQKLSLKPSSQGKTRLREGFEEFRILYCGVCRTDAKIWDEGHHDLTFPRILGHEFVVADGRGRRYAVWPAISCGRCECCKTGRENICNDIEILGFHRDGGYADKIELLRKNLFAVEGVRDHIVCFAEPVACSINALEKLRVRPGQRVIIYGGGTQGLITALLVKDAGAEAVIIEKNQSKIDKAKRFCREGAVDIRKETNDADYDGAINACQSTIAFSLCLTKLRKGGRLCFFSGLPKNDRIENNLTNLIHYKEFEIYGAYGQAPSHIGRSIPYLVKYQDWLDLLVEAVIEPEQVDSKMSCVLRGDAYKFIIDFSKRTKPEHASALQTKHGDEQTIEKTRATTYHKR